MALTGGYQEMTGDPILLTSFLTDGPVKQIDVFANDANAAAIYIGPSTVLADGTNAIIALAAGKPWGHKVPGAAEQVNLELSTLYVVGTAADKVHIAIVR